MFNFIKALVGQIRHEAGAAKPAPALQAQIVLEIDTLIGRGDLAAAEQALAHLVATNPADADVAMLQARLAQKRGDRQQAMMQFQRAIALAPALGAAHVELGKLYTAAGSAEHARASYREAIRLIPDNAELHNHFGVACLDARHLNDAQRSFERALDLRADFAAARNNLGRVFRERGEYALALDTFASLPGYFHARVNTGLVLNELGEFAQAHTVLAACVEEHPDDVQALCGLGAACYGLARVDAAQVYCRAAQARDPNSAAARFTLGNIALLRGDFSAGWPLYEARTALGRFARRYEQDLPAWDGEPLPGRTLLVFAEQGYGDTLLFARFLPLLATRSRATIVFRSQRALARLFADNCPHRIVIAGEREAIKADVAVPLLSVGGLLGIARADLPGVIPYIRAADQAAIAWRERLASDTRIRVGVASAGNSERVHEHNRVPGAGAYAPLSLVNGISFYNLQPGRDAVEQAGVPLPLIDFSGELRDFADTAALIANLDLVISVDTSVAHLAGAMGKPTLLLHAGTPDWRWAIAHADSPWYPTVEVFRRTGGRWDFAMAAIASALANFAR